MPVLISDGDYREYLAFLEKKRFMKKVESVISLMNLSERAVLRIHSMEKALLSLFKGEFLEEVVLTDTNKMQERLLHNWQYPSLNDWVIKRKDILGV